MSVTKQMQNGKPEDNFLHYCAHWNTNQSGNMMKKILKFVNLCKEL